MGFKRCAAPVAALALLALLAGPACTGQAADPSARAAAQTSPLEIDTASGPKIFQVEVVDTPAAQREGLMYRKNLAADAGMLFPFPGDEPRAFWMKNTFISLDMIFIRSDGEIVAIARDTEPLSTRPIAPFEPAHAVLEVNAGTAARLGIAVGDHVRHSAIGTSSARGR